MVFVSIRTAAGDGKRLSAIKWLAVTLALGCLRAGLPASEAQSSPSQPQDGQAQTAQPQAAQAQPPQNIPDAPSAVQPPSATPEPPSIPRPEEKKPVERDPWTNLPITKPAAAEAGPRPRATSAP